MKALLKSLISHFSSANDNVKPSVGLNNGTIAIFASADQGKTIIITRDDYLTRLSPFDRNSKMKAGRAVGGHEFLEFYEKNTMEWNEQEKQKITTALENFKAKTSHLFLTFPNEVLFIKTTGDEEGGAAYTRANAIFFPEAFMTIPQDRINWFVAHELFHVLTRNNPQLREQLYNAIGFEKVDEIELPEGIKERKISNPDAPINQHVLKLTVDGTDQWAAPIIFSREKDFDAESGDTFFQYLEFRFMLVERDGDKVTPLYDENGPRLLTKEQAVGFYEQVGKNTDYIIHPEEILAENFVHTLFETKDLPSPEITSKIDRILKDYGSARLLLDRPMPFM